MDSPPSCSLSATGPLSDLGSSGIGGSISSDSVRAHLAIEMQESDIESKSLSQDSFDYSDGMCGENFNTLKKGPGWGDADGKLEVEVVDVAIKPPPEFQDSPSPPDSESSSAPILSDARSMTEKTPGWIDDYAENLVQSVIEEALATSCRISWPEGRIASGKAAINPAPVAPRNNHNPKRLWATDLLTPSCQAAATLSITPYSTLNRPNSRCSLTSSRLSSSHNSINTAGLSHKADDSSFITSAMSHDVLTTSEISDMYNVPFDSDIYTVPIDVVRPLHDLRTPQRPKRHRHHRKRRRNVSASSQSELEAHIQQARHYCGKPRAITHVIKSQRLLAEVCCNEAGNGKRHSVPGTSGRHGSRTANGHMHNIGEPIHMTLHEVRQYLQTLYSSSSDSSENKLKRDNKPPISHVPIHLGMSKGVSVNNNNRYSNPHTDSPTDTPISNKSSNGLIHNNNNNANTKKHKKNTFVALKHKKVREEAHKDKVDSEREKIKKSQRNFSLNLKQTLCNIFRFRRLGSPDHFVEKRNSIVQGEIVEEEESVDSDQHANNNNTTTDIESSQKLPFFKRALPPLPKTNGHVGVEQAEDALTSMVSKCDSPPSAQQIPAAPVPPPLAPISATAPATAPASVSVSASATASASVPPPAPASATASIATPAPALASAPVIAPVLTPAPATASASVPASAATATPAAAPTAAPAAAAAPIPVTVPAPVPASAPVTVSATTTASVSISICASTSASGTAIAHNHPHTHSHSHIHSHNHPHPKHDEEATEDISMDFAASIEKVKDYGWYWGPISGEAAEKILSNEPDGSFIVRDSSDDHYIFSLSFRLNSCVRHVRIEHDQGNFSFGSCTKFKSHTIVDFIESAVEHSRSGRYLFFLHRRPVLGPMRVQLLHPVSRFKQVQSLQHTCRFVILKMVRRDLIPTLPLPRRLIDYLSTPHYYSEQLAEQDDRAESPVSSSTGELEKICFTPQGLS